MPQRLPADSASGPNPEWQFGGYPYRMIFTLPPEADSDALVRLPRTSRMPVTPDAFALVNAARKPIPFRVAYADADEVTIQFSFSAESLRPPCCLYFGATNALSPTNAADPDPEPLLAVLRPAGGVAVPETLERLRYMTQSLNFLPPLQSVGSFDEVPSLATPSKAERGRKRGWRGPGWGINAGALRTYVACPEDGLYRFGVDCRDAASVTLDGKEVVSRLGVHSPDGWHMGKPVVLNSGVHRLDVITVFAWTNCHLRVGWVLPRGKEIRPIERPDMLGSCEAVETRVERANRILQPGFTFTLGKPYRFRELPHVFTPVRFVNTTADWVTGDFTTRWKFGDGRQEEAFGATRVYASADQFKATLEVRDALGYVASCSRVVDCRGIEPEDYAVSFDLGGIPFACYGRDRLAPLVNIDSSGLPSLPFDVRFKARMRSGQVVERSKRAIVASTAVQALAEEWSAGELSELAWDAQHEGTTLAQGVVRFLKPPFDAWPAEVEGTALYDARGTRLVLVADEGGAARANRPPSAGRGERAVVCVDDTLAADGLHNPRSSESFHSVLRRLLDGTSHSVRYASLPAWQKFEGSSGPARKFVDVPAALGTNVATVVLSIGLREMLNGQTEEAFERQVAALTDMLATRKGLRIVWATPPPYPSDRERARGFAAVIRRVAAARGVVVADVFSRFLCAEGKRSAFFTDNPLILSDPGQRMAAQEIARALLEAEK